MYGKIFASMFKGSLYGQWEAIVTFTVMIVLADQHGEVDMTHESLSAQTSIPLDIIQKGIALLEAPDPKSRTPDDEGRRIVRVSDSRDWGWQITNYAHYRAIRSLEERREYMKQYQRERRAKVNKVNQPSTSVNKVTHAVSSKQEADGEAETTTLADKFEREDERTAYLGARRAVDVPVSFDAMLGGLHSGIGDGKPFDWSTIGRAIVEVQAAGSKVTANSLRAFCKKLTNPASPVDADAARKTKLLKALETVDASR